MEHMKRLEGEVRDMLQSLGETQTVFEGTGHSVDPHQFLGIEINPRAAAIAELVLWIGYLQWHFRTFGAKMPAEPIIKPFHNIECRDAVLEYDRKEPVLDADCKPVTRWDGRTIKKHPVTGEDVPDESARTLVFRYVNPRKAAWPKADFVVGNPPFLGNWTMRALLGRRLRRDAASRLSGDARVGRLRDVLVAPRRRAGLRRCSSPFWSDHDEQHSPDVRASRDPDSSRAAAPLSLVYAIPDHPWVDDSDGADVRIAMTVGVAGRAEGVLERVVREEDNDRRRFAGGAFATPRAHQCGSHCRGGCDEALFPFRPMKD